ncbi:MAG: FAD-dependent oxidoreductase [Planctomycetes bacterium]|nr:FAD-dependent oxidoreductase [Planctomycetota bacterium]
MDCDVVIFGGGAAGLWLLDELTRRGDRALLLEAGQLGQGQTVASQGILHGGLKYTLQGLLTPAAREIRDMPEIWRQCLAGRRNPNLQDTHVRSQHCYLWRSDTLRSRLGMIGAKVGLQVAPQELSDADRPAALAGCPGTVARLEEQVISPASFLADLARQHHDRILAIDSREGVQLTLSAPGQVTAINLTHPDQPAPLQLRPRQVVLTAGAGNDALRVQCGLPAGKMQRRPLHMVLARGPLPLLHGHCVDGARTRVTITSDHDQAGRTVWQLGGQLAEDGVSCDELNLLHRAHAEFTAVLPGIDLSRVEWSTYRVDRAEQASPRGSRPDTATLIHEGNVTTAWPTKLALAPQLARMLIECLPAATNQTETTATMAAKLAGWPRPEVALPPWESARNWISLTEPGTLRRAA